MLNHFGSDWATAPWETMNITEEREKASKPTERAWEQAARALEPARRTSDGGVSEPFERAS